MESARYRLGPVRVFPKLSVGNAGYNSNVFGSSENEEVSDWEATATAGARLLLPFGKKVYVQADVLPQYNWYASEKDLRNFGGHYGATAFAFFNRLSVEASGAYTDLSATPTSESASPAIQRQTSGSGTLALEITRAVSLLGGGGARRTRYDSLPGSPIPIASLADQDRTDSSFFGGVRHSLLGPLVVTLIAADGRAEFVNKASQRDNETRSYMANVLVSAQRIFVNATGGYRKGRSLHGSLLPSFNSPIASAFVSWFPSSSLELQAWGYYRNVSYSLDPNYPLFYESRYGGGPVLRFGPRIRVQLYGSSGKNDYSVTSAAAAPPPQASTRRTTYGGSMSMLFSRVIVLNVGASADRYRSPVPDQNRKVVRLLTGLSFEGFPTP